MSLPTPASGEASEPNHSLPPIPNIDDHVMTPLKLRYIADFLDLADKAFQRLAKLQSLEPAPLGSGVQEDLGLWADQLSEGNLNAQSIDAP